MRRQTNGTPRSTIGGTFLAFMKLFRDLLRLLLPLIHEPPKNLIYILRKTAFNKRCKLIKIDTWGLHNL